MTKKPDTYWLFKAITLVPLLLSGCVSFSEPVQTGENTYMITANAHGGFSSNGELEGETIQKAKDFCATQGLKATLQNASASGVQGWTPQNTQVVFNCLPSCDELYADPALDAIRTKVALGEIKDQTLAMRTNNSKPTGPEMAAIALWDQKRQLCRAGEPSGIAQSTAGAVLVNSHEDMEQLIAQLYSGQITYGQFASIRSGLFEHAVTGTAQALETAKIENATAAAALTSAQAQQQAALNQMSNNQPGTVQIITPPGSRVITPNQYNGPTGFAAGIQQGQEQALRMQLLQQQIANQRAINQQLSGQ